MTQVGVSNITLTLLLKVHNVCDSKCVVKFTCQYNNNNDSYHMDSFFIEKSKKNILIAFISFIWNEK